MLLVFLFEHPDFRQNFCVYTIGIKVDHKKIKPSNTRKACTDDGTMLLRKKEKEIKNKSTLHFISIDVCIYIYI